METNLTSVSKSAHDVKIRVVHNKEDSHRLQEDIDRLKNWMK